MESRRDDATQCVAETYKWNGGLMVGRRTLGRALKAKLSEGRKTLWRGLHSVCKHWKQWIPTNKSFSSVLANKVLLPGGLGWWIALRYTLVHPFSAADKQRVLNRIGQGCATFLSVGHITNFRHLAGPHEKFSFFMYTSVFPCTSGFSCMMGKNQSVGKGHTKWLGGPSCGPWAACCTPLV